MATCNSLMRIPTWQFLNVHTKVHTVLSRWSSFDVKRQSRIMKKLMTGSKKNWYKNTEKIVAVRPGSLSSLTPPKQNNTRRINVLNTVLIKAITEVMSTGEVGAELLENNVEITRVKVAQDFNTVNVYWFSPAKDSLSTIEQLLSENAWEFRSELCSLRVLGNVPHLKFVKDKDHIKGTEILSMLNNLSIDTNIDSNDPADGTKSCQENLDTKVEETHEVVHDPSVEDEPLCAIAPCLRPTEFPADMKMDMYGLDYKTMMKSLTDRINQTKAVHRREESISNEEHEAVAPVQVPIQSDSMHFKEFLRERKIARNKEKKREHHRIFISEDFDEEQEDNQVDEQFQDVDDMSDEEVTHK